MTPLLQLQEHGLLTASTGILLQVSTNAEIRTMRPATTTLLILKLITALISMQLIREAVSLLTGWTRMDTWSFFSTPTSVFTLSMLTVQPFQFQQDRVFLPEMLSEVSEVPVSPQVITSTSEYVIHL